VAVIAASTIASPTHWSTPSGVWGGHTSALEMGREIVIDN
jgi:hypothetical protein